MGTPEVHGFSDGGNLAFEAVIFLRWELEDGGYICVPVMVKSFVAPLKRKTIPRLELLGCLILIRLYVTCCKALDFVNFRHCERIFWIDSQTVLSWVKLRQESLDPLFQSG